MKLQLIDSSKRGSLKLPLFTSCDRSLQTITGGMVVGGSSTGGGCVPGGSCSGTGSGSVGGNVGLSILGSGVSAGIGIFIGVASFVLCSIGGQSRGGFDSPPDGGISA